MNIPWKPERDGDDIVIHHARVTCFGGDSDPQDNGETASGVNTKRNPKLKGCALPIRLRIPELRDSPLPRIQWHAPVIFTDEATGKALEVELIDCGPALHTGNAGDLTIAAARFFNPQASAINFEMRATIRLPGMAYLLA